MLWPELPASQLEPCIDTHRWAALVVRDMDTPPTLRGPLPKGCSFPFEPRFQAGGAWVFLGITGRLWGSRALSRQAWRLRPPARPAVGSGPDAVSRPDLGRSLSNVPSRILVLFVNPLWFAGGISEISFFWVSTVGRSDCTFA